MPLEALAPEQLFHVCDPDGLPFTTSSELEDISPTIGQSRALDAIHFGVGIRHAGYNLFVSGSTGLGKHTAVRAVLEEQAAQAPAPADWCYTNNFEQPHKPRTLRLPTGQAQRLRRDTAQLVEDLLHAIPAAFQSDEYRSQVQEIHDEFRQREEQAFSELNEKARREGVAMLRTPAGYTLAPLRGDAVLGPEEFEQLTKEEQQRIEHVTEALKEELKGMIGKVPIWQKESRERLKALDAEVTKLTVDQLIAELQRSYQDLPDVLAFLGAIQQDVIENVDAFRKQGDEEAGSKPNHRSREFNRYVVNALVDNGGISGAPVIYEDNPTYQNLVGRIEHLAQFGTLLTDFSLIKPGALHQANGGYLILDSLKVLTSPFAWAGLKRALRSREVHIESVEQMLSLGGTISLDPQPIPIDIKVVLTGDRLLYYLLKQYDPEFSLLFKVSADFSEDIERNSDTTMLYARLIATLARREKLRPIDRGGVARVLEHSARRMEDSEKLSLHMGNLLDLLREADYWAGEAGRDMLTRTDVQHAIDTQLRRADQLRERVQEAILRGTLMIDTEGSQVAQVNGLSVVQLGDFAFGRPSRITATARLGEGEVVDIEREVELGGAIHSKGVLILTSYLANRYAQDHPLSLSASLVFEQSYGMVEGDSASVAELCALLSALANLPIRQSMAVTGSVNQLGQVQAIGGVNEKIEGFFDICKARKLSGEQGVVIPRSNTKHLMLHQEVLQAAERDQFGVYAASHVDQVIELLTGMPAGKEDAQGNFPEGTVNHRVQQRLIELTRIEQRFSEHAKGDSRNVPDRA